MEGLLGADLVGFQRPAAAANFVQLARRLHDLPARGQMIEYDGRTVAARAFPISIDVPGRDTRAVLKDVIRETKGFRQEVGESNPTDFGWHQAEARLAVKRCFQQGSPVSGPLLPLRRCGCG